MVVNIKNINILGRNICKEGVKAAVDFQANGIDIS